MKPEIRVVTDLTEIGRAAAEIFIQSAAVANAERGRFLVSLSGGNTPMGLYRLLATVPYRERVDWGRTHVFWGDERCVPADDPGNCYGQAKQALLDHVSIPGANIHPIDTRLQPAEAAVDYARRLNAFADAPLEWPRFDLVLLGMGDDAHTASLFPGSRVAETTPTVAVTANYQDRPAQRVSLTPLVFNAARRIVFLASGASKAEPLAKVLFGDYHPENLPAQRIRPEEGEVIWLVDEAAGSKIEI